MKKEKYLSLILQVNAKAPKHIQKAVIIVDKEYKYCIQVINNKCTNSEYQYRLGEDKKCSSTLYCLESENGKCIKCLDNYYLGKDDMCTEVEHCIYSYFYECVECEDELYYNKFEKNAQKLKKFLKIIKFLIMKENIVLNVKKIII